MTFSAVMFESSHHFICENPLNIEDIVRLRRARLTLPFGQQIVEQVGQPLNLRETCDRIISWPTDPPLPDTRERGPCHESPAEFRATPGQLPGFQTEVGRCFAALDIRQTFLVVKASSCLRLLRVEDVFFAERRHIRARGNICRLPLLS